MKATPIVASRFRDDGGATFGLVPRTIWENLLPPDDNNTVRQHLNSLLIELSDGRKGLLDVGWGNPDWFSTREREYRSLESEWALLSALDALETSADEVEFVVLTHLHHDHAGGLGFCPEDGDTQVTFPNATVFTHATEWDLATAGDPLLFRAYPKIVIAPLQALSPEKIFLVDEDVTTVLPGITMIKSGGHTEGHCTLLIGDGESLQIDHPDLRDAPGSLKLLYAGDVCGMSHHLRLVYQYSYDTHPMDTRRWKREWLPRVAHDEILIMFDHDPDLCGAFLQPDEHREFVVERGIACPGHD